jgi:hypothetical protein
MSIFSGKRIDKSKPRAVFVQNRILRAFKPLPKCGLEWHNVSTLAFVRADEEHSRF